MQSYRRIIACSTVVFALFIACREPTIAVSPHVVPDGTSPPTNGAAVLASMARRPETLDEHFARLADSIPGFAGSYFDAAGRQVVALTSAGDSSRVFAIAAALVPVSAGQPASFQSVIHRRVQFNYRLLKSERDYVNRVLFQLPGVVSSDIDEVNNRVVVGVVNTEALPAVRSAISAAGLKTVSAELEHTPTAGSGIVMTSQSCSGASTALFSCFPQPMGGVEISNPSGRRCTLGFNTILSSTQNANYDFGQYFVTNAHCTSVLGYNDGTQFYQPDQQTSPAFAQEVREPLWRTYPAESTCPAGLQCSMADAALVRYNFTDFNWAIGKIARTYGPYSSSLSTPGSSLIDPQSPTFAIKDSAETSAMLGQMVYKMGIATGWTGNPINSTCKDWRLFQNNVPTNFVLMCQYGFPSTSKFGDSGSPVFKLSGTNNSRATITGLTWSDDGGYGMTYFSQYSYIAWELTDRDYSIACPYGGACWPRLAVSGP